MNIFKYLILLLLLTSVPYSSHAQDEATMFIFGHSLINHEYQINETPSQETSVPHWLHFLSQAGNKEFKVSGQYGFLPNHANLPPFAQWGFDFATPAWESDYETFAEANFSHVMLTPGNFIQWQAPNINYPNENVSPLSASNTIIEWCYNQNQNLKFYIYENWPDMAPFLGSGFPPSISEWNDYNQFLQSDFIDWYDQYYNLIKDSHPDHCINLIPVGSLISRLLQSEPYNQININQLYEDDAPHGRPSIYFLAAMITYMAIYEETCPANYEPTSFIDPIIANNYLEIRDFFWNELLQFNTSNGTSKVFCNSPNPISEIENNKPLSIFPNPAVDAFTIKNLKDEIHLSLYDNTGRLIKQKTLSPTNPNFKLENLSDGIYFVKTHHLESSQTQFQKLIVSQ